MDQPVPLVTRTDVERVVRRDYPADQYLSVMGILAEYGGEEWHRERHRVQVAALKLAAGNMEVLRREVASAKSDYRDVLAYAEYPGYMQKTSGISQLAAAEERRIIDEDWLQYEAWFKK